MAEEAKLGHVEEEEVVDAGVNAEGVGIAVAVETRVAEGRVEKVESQSVRLRFGADLKDDLARR